MVPRLIRRRPLHERVKAYLDPVDFLLWLSEELHSSDWDRWGKKWANSIGIISNVVFLIARANTGYSTSRIADDVFGDEVAYTSWASLFESSVDTAPSTPSAHRVNVDSSPVASSPLRFLSNMLAGDNGEARSHPDATRHVWEIAVWDPTPISLRMFCLLSPGHVLVYWLFLPTKVSDPRPSITVLITIFLAGLLSAQLLLLSSSFSQQSKDASVIHKEVMNEYDIKFVHPRTQPLTRDVGTQHSSLRQSNGVSSHNDRRNDAVDTYKPTYIINKGFQTRPNPNYASYIVPEGSAHRATPLRETSTNIGAAFQTPSHLRDMSSPLRPQTAIRQSQFRPAFEGDGGSLGVYTHAESPLRNSLSINSLRPLGQRESLSPQKTDGSPRKRNRLAPRPNGY
ncbi:MAG: hypothetical protein Q9163_004314 [Psora crenata]